MQAALAKADIAEFLGQLGSLQVYGTGTQMARFFSVPIPYYLPDRILVFSDRVKLAERFDTHRAYLRLCGVTKIEARALTVHDATTSRALVALNWHYMNAADMTLRRSEVQYVLCKTPRAGQLRIEMVDYAALAFPQFMRTSLSLGRA